MKMIPKITGKQVNLILAKFGEVGIRGNIPIMEWIEFNCEIEVAKLEDINAGQLDIILTTLKRKFND